jgi:hypothetical protein
LGLPLASAGSGPPAAGPAEAPFGGFGPKAAPTPFSWGKDSRQDGRKLESDPKLGNHPELRNEPKLKNDLELKSDPTPKNDSKLENRPKLKNHPKPEKCAGMAEGSVQDSGDDELLLALGWGVAQGLCGR